MKRFIRRWRETKARRDRMASMLAKFPEILFWLVVVGPVAIQPPISILWWASGFLLLVAMAAGSYWYSQDRTPGKGGN